jgi:hypothetical protein
MFGPMRCSHVLCRFLDISITLHWLNASSFLLGPSPSGLLESTDYGSTIIAKAVQGFFGGTIVDGNYTVTSSSPSVSSSPLHYCQPA